MDMDGGSRLAAVIARRRRLGRLRLLLDYDGTLVPIAPTPERATPDADLYRLLDGLLRSPDLDVEIVSGRARDTLAAWFGDRRLSLWAEHGLWHRAAGTEAWRETVAGSDDWMRQCLPVLQRFAAETRGARIERKTSSLAWHFREAHPELGLGQARALRELLREMAARRGFEVMDGKMVIDLRRAGISKAIVAHRLAEHGVPSRQVIAFGDDRTDEELFNALPAESVTVAVGPAIVEARYRLEDHREVRRLLASLVSPSPRDAIR
jgi:trehalose 6-phosphate synthase/phosphatase